MISIDGTLQFCADLDLAPEDVLLLALAYELHSPRMGEWPRKGWIDGWKALGCVPLSLSFPPAADADAPRARAGWTPSRACSRSCPACARSSHTMPRTSPRSTSTRLSSAGPRASAVSVRSCACPTPGPAGAEARELTGRARSDRHREGVLGDPAPDGARRRRALAHDELAGCVRFSRFVRALGLMERGLACVLCICLPAHSRR